MGNIDESKGFVSVVDRGLKAACNGDQHQRRWPDRYGNADGECGKHDAYRPENYTIQRDSAYADDCERSGRDCNDLRKCSGNRNGDVNACEQRAGRQDIWIHDYRLMMEDDFKLSIIQPQFVDFAWRDGASCLDQICELTEEIAPGQIKMMLARGERMLLCATQGEKKICWVTARVDQLPNVRVFHVTDLVCQGRGFALFFDKLKEIARAMGCSQIRCSAPEAQARLYKMKLGFKHVYETLKVEL